MTAHALVAAALVAGAVVLATPGRAHLGPGSSADGADRADLRGRRTDDRGVLLRLRPVLVAFAFLAGWIVIGGAIGLIAGVAAAVVSWRVLGRTEGPRARARRRELAEDLPVAVHLLGACLGAGAAPTSAIRSVAAALPGAVAAELGAIAARLDLGVDPVSVWRDVASDGPLAPLGRSLARAHESGGSVTDAIGRLSEDLRASVRSRSAARARTVEVRAAAPLGACLLPAFLLLGVVPLTVGIFSSLRLFG